MKPSSYRPIRQHRPFWQADKPYLDKQTISDIRFRLLGYVMAMLAGAINAGGFFAVSSYTSHVTGSLSHTADNIILGEWRLAGSALVGVCCFVLGAAHANWTILWVQRQRGRSSYGVSMWIEAIYLLGLGVLATIFADYVAVRELVITFALCFIMGMHNTVMSVLSGSAVRSTHMTGTATDLGIELSKILYYSRKNNPRLPNVEPNWKKVRFFSLMMVSFLLGGVIGTWGYTRVGYYFTLPVAILLFIFGYGSIQYDLKLRMKWWLAKRKQRRIKKTDKTKGNE